MNAGNEIQLQMKADMTSNRVKNNFKVRQVASPDSFFSRYDKRLVDNRNTDAIELE